MKKLLISFAILNIAPLFAQKNLIKNGSFELEADSWRGENILTINPYLKRSGDKGGNIYEYTSPSWKGIDQEFIIPKNTAALEISAWVKTDAVEKGKNNWNKAVIVLEIGGKTQNIADLEGTTPWQLVKKIIPTENNRSGRLMLALSECTGSFLFDDIKVTPISKDDYAKIVDEDIKKKEAISLQTSQNPSSNPNTEEFTNGNFENGTFSWRGAVNLSNTIKKEGNAALVLTSASKDWVGVDQIFNVQKEAKSVTITGWLKSENIVQGENPWNNGLLNVEFSTDGKNKTANDESITFVTGTKDWQQYSKTFNLPKDTQKLRLMIALGFATGTLYADDIQVKFNP
ncbi:hypothetical protein GCM10010992_04610 [Cloacibacterium rupense]|uniref:CBM-cenC domain-containing protein n=1 Tax=Cloacibacterium rupense TaxID=517423 RepID=A0ABQ2NH41_9FLAO|nr:carbohydrate binding domain-containing protein [Cloacibacterium rupense]GGP01996.1 hypothetical protein GCM10010992_04610 [Cloacibacterium rupense]